jgi:hypothetical protein
MAAERGKVLDSWQRSGAVLRALVQEVERLESG